MERELSIDTRAKVNLGKTVLGIVGKKRAGKDTFAARLVEAHGFTRYAFADGIRKALYLLDPLVEVRPSHVRRLAQWVDKVGWERAKAEPEVRRLLQCYGEGIRHLDPDVWIRPVLTAISVNDGPVVITDVRYRNEALRILGLGGALVRVVRPGQDDGDRHASETEMDCYAIDQVINDGSVEQLWDVADNLVHAITGNR